MQYSLTGAWLCHPGKARAQNEDACLAAGVLSAGDSGLARRLAAVSLPWMVAVSDGIGGHHGGAQASLAVVHALAECERVTETGVRQTLRQVNRQLCARGRADETLAGLGATVAGVACGRKGPFIFHVGDSRVYRLEAGGLVQLTRDDSEAEELIEIGLLTRDDSVRPGFLHALTQAIGGRLEYTAIEVHTQPLQIGKRTRFLICSDGLTDMLGRRSLEEMMRAERPCEATVEALFGAAMQAGGLDNITLAVLDVEPEIQPPPGSAQS